MTPVHSDIVQSDSSQSVIGEKKTEGAADPLLGEPRVGGGGGDGGEVSIPGLSRSLCSDRDRSLTTGNSRHFFFPAGSRDLQGHSRSRPIRAGEKTLVAVLVEHVPAISGHVSALPAGGDENATLFGCGLK